MSTSYAEKVYGDIINCHEWSYSELTELLELLDVKQIELAKEEDFSPKEISLPDEWDYSIIEKENAEAIIDLPY